MTQNIQKIFKNLKNAELSAGLEEKILKNIAYKSKWRLQRRLIFADILMLGSAGAFVFAILNLWEGISKSAFWSLANLAISDTGAVMSFWKDFLLSLLETFPAGYLALILAPIFLFLLSANFYFKSTNGNHTKSWVCDARVG